MPTRRPHTNTTTTTLFRWLLRYSQPSAVATCDTRALHLHPGWFDCFPSGIFPASFHVFFIHRRFHLRILTLFGTFLVRLALRISAPGPPVSCETGSFRPPRTSCRRTTQPGLDTGNRSTVVTARLFRLNELPARNFAPIQYKNMSCPPPAASIRSGIGTRTC